MSALYIGELKSILSQFDESWNEGFSRKHWSIVNGAYDCAYELHYYDDKYNDQFLLTCIMDRFDTPKSAQYEIGFNKAFNDSQINQILDTLNEYLGHNFTCSLRENNESSTIQPQTTEELAAIIKQTCEEQGWNCDLNFIDTSKITDMSYLFSDNEEYGYGLEHFNGDISKWNTSNVTEMYEMFCGAKNFNQPLNNWDTSKVTNMEGMFGEAHSFNQPLDNWDVSNVTSMWAMFSNAHSFNQPLDNWNTNNVDDMTFMFSDAKSFKSEIPDFRNYKGTKEELFDELGLPPDFKPKIKKEQEQEKVHKKSRV